MENNYDHHEEDGPKNSATLQLWNQLQGNINVDPYIANCVSYINIIDTKGPKAFENYGKLLESNTFLTDVFSGMCLVERKPTHQFLKGILILKTIIEERKENPFDPISPEGWEKYINAKKENRRQLTKVIKDATTVTTKSGKTLSYLETEFYGAPGALYANGASIVIALNPNFKGVRKFTIASNNGKINQVLEELAQLEKGWGGPPTGTIIGSPREGSKLTLKQVVEIAVEKL
jgi:hypothetical protein